MREMSKWAAISAPCVPLPAPGGPIIRIRICPLLRPDPRAPSALAPAPPAPPSSSATGSSARPPPQGSSTGPPDVPDPGRSRQALAGCGQPADADVGEQLVAGPGPAGQP